MATTGTLRHDVAFATELAELRHRLHRTPEVGLNLPKTQAIVLEALEGLGLEITTGRSLSSVIAVLRGGRPGDAVLLRGDMDGLPVAEETGLEYASTNGAMHACGHDMHTAGLVGAARILAAQREELAGSVVFMFQPGEEGWDGAGAMLAEGLLQAAGCPVRAAFALHVQSNKVPNGVFTSRPGAILAASSRVSVTVRGRGTHGSSPHFGRDPITAAAAIIMTLQTQVTRRFDIFDPVVITVGAIAGGARANVIPDEVTFEATVRTFSRKTISVVESLVHDVCDGVTKAHDMSADVTFWHEYPETVNDPEQFEFLADTVKDLFGPERFLLQAVPTPGSEDFSRILREVPGCYVTLGASVNPDYTRGEPNHGSRAAFDDAVLSDGALLLSELARRTLSRLANQENPKTS